MILKSDLIAHRIESPEFRADPLIIAPRPDLQKLKGEGTASVDLRLGTWFMELRRTRTSSLGIMRSKTEPQDEENLARTLYTPFGKEFLLHPQSFILGITLEWIRLPKDLAAYVVGKSSWGRRGLIIATAIGVHPGFTGCITLELSNLGEIPIVIKPGMPICQLFVHTVDSGSDPTSKSKFAAYRKPILGEITEDPIAEALSGEDSSL